MYFITVGNIGQVAEYATEDQARATFDEYVLASKENQGRASGESVVLWCENEPIADYTGSLDDLGD